MKRNNYWCDLFSVAISVGVLVIFGALLFFTDRRLSFVMLICALVVLSASLVRFFIFRFGYKKFIVNLSDRYDYTKENVLSTFPLPSVVCRGDGTIVWCNSKFYSMISGPDITPDSKIFPYVSDVSVDDLLSEDTTCVLVNERYYDVFTAEYEYKFEKYCVLYYSDVTGLKNTEKEFFRTRPYMLIASVDSVDDNDTDFRDSETSEIRSAIDSIISDWCDKYDCSMKKIDDERCIILARSCDLDKMKADKFSVLDKVREYEYKGRKINSTVSIGISGGLTFSECDSGARKALEMALGRGGDQVALKTKDGFDFFGGISQSNERKNKVRERVVASAVNELVKNCDRIFVMGHKCSDFDVLGAAAGICCIGRSKKIPSTILVDKTTSLAGPLINLLEGVCDFGTASSVSEEITKKSVLFIVDTHISGITEYPEIIKRFSSVIVLDHHRRQVDESYSPTLFHIDTSASSASEIVTEILQYIIPEPQVDKESAEALLSGIMLDTKDFVLRVGVHTFEAAAFLKDKDADPVKVKKLFANSLEVNKLRNEVILSAEEYKRCAVSFASCQSDSIRIIASQAADELLNTDNIDASFVLYINGKDVNISARSMGRINVQLVMEYLGGGGHRTMAACQLKDTDKESALKKLYDAIDRYDEEIRKD